MEVKRNVLICDELKFSERQIEGVEKVIIRILDQDRGFYRK